MPKVSHKARLAELRALRQSGKKAFDSYQVEQVDDIYDNVDEDGYKKLVRERLNQDDFVVDDNGEGYADDGREEWDRVQRYESDSEADDVGPRGRPSKAGSSYSASLRGKA
jgi:DNA polymerase alpha subunit A